MALAIQARPTNPRRPRIVLSGNPGTGKSTAACTIPGAITQPVEDGIGHLAVDSLARPTSWVDLMGQTMSLINEQHAYTTFVVDSVTAAERLCFDEVCREAGVASIEKVGNGYGKGYTRAGELCSQWLGLLDRLRLERHMTIILITHSAVVKVPNPMGEDFIRNGIKLNEKAFGARIVEWSDAVLYLYFAVRTTTNESGKIIGIGDGERMIATEERPGYLAKNRYRLPPVIPLDGWWDTIRAAVRATVAPTTTPPPLAAQADGTNAPAA